MKNDLLKQLGSCGYKVNQDLAGNIYIEDIVISKTEMETAILDIQEKISEAKKDGRLQSARSGFVSKLRKCT